MLFGAFDSKLQRVALFIDGGYFSEVSNYYKFQHQRKARLNLDGIQSFIRKKAAECEKVDEAYCQIVESHYFRGRFSTATAAAKGKLEDERRFDDILIRAGIVQHYLPIDESKQKPSEKGIDVWLSLEAFDLAVHKRFDVLALVACDGDYVPLVRKLNGIGTRVMLLAWDFTYEFNGKHKETRTSGELIKVSTYPVMMNSIIDDRSNQDKAFVKDLFLP